MVPLVPKATHRAFLEGFCNKMGAAGNTNHLGFWKVGSEEKGPFSFGVRISKKRSNSVTRNPRFLVQSMAFCLMAAVSYPPRLSLNGLRDLSHGA